MDENNIRNTRRIFESDPLNKVRKLMDYTSRHGDVADPWYTGDFKTTYRDIFEGCTCLYEFLSKKEWKGKSTDYKERWL